MAFASSVTFIVTVFQTCTATTQWTVQEYESIQRFTSSNLANVNFTVAASPVDDRCNESAFPIDATRPVTETDLTAPSSLNTLHSTLLTGFGVNDTLSCMKELRLLFSSPNLNETNQQNKSPTLMMIWDSSTRLERLLNSLISPFTKPNSSKEGFVTSPAIVLQICSAMFPVCKNGQRISPCETGCRKTRSVVESLKPFVRMDAIPILSILSEASEMCSLSAKSPCKKGNSSVSYILTQSLSEYQRADVLPQTEGFCFNSECRSPLFSTSNKEHWDESVRQVLLSIHTTVNSVFPNSSLPFNESVLPCGRECMSIGYSKSQHRIARVLLTVFSTISAGSVFFATAVFYFNKDSFGQQYVRRMLTMFTFCAGVAMIPFIFSVMENRKLTCHTDGTLVTHAPRLSYTCGYVAWHVQFFGTLSLGYGVFMCYAWQQVCVQVTTLVASPGMRSHSLITWWTKHRMDVVSSVVAFVPAAAVTLAVVGQDGYEGAPILGICWRSITRGFSPYYSWYHMSATAVSAVILSHGIFLLLRSFGLLGTVQWLKDSTSRVNQTPLQKRRSHALRRFSQLMFLYLFLCMFTLLAYLGESVHTGASIDEWREQEYRHLKCILTSCRPETCPALPKHSLLTPVVRLLMSFSAMFVMSTWAFSKVYLVSVPGLRFLIKQNKPPEENGHKSPDTSHDLA